MAVKFSGSSSLLLVMTTSIFVIVMSKPNWSQQNFPPMPPNSWGGFGGGASCSCGRDADILDLCKKTGPNEFIVGGSENWRLGYNYTVWAGNMCAAGILRVHDVLVFKYEKPLHSVYLLKDLGSYKNCSLESATKICDVNKVAGSEGCSFVLNGTGPYYFACGEGKKGYHCNQGMKFAVWPIPTWN